MKKLYTLLFPLLGALLLTACGQPTLSESDQKALALGHSELWTLAEYRKTTTIEKDAFMKNLIGYMADTQVEQGFIAEDMHATYVSEVSKGMIDCLVGDEVKVMGDDTRLSQPLGICRTTVIKSFVDSHELPRLPVRVFQKTKDDNRQYFLQQMAMGVFREESQAGNLSVEAGNDFIQASLSVLENCLDSADANTDVEKSVTECRATDAYKNMLESVKAMTKENQQGMKKGKGKSKGK